MQQLTGKIVSVQPTAEGGYNGSNGWINTFTMTIQGPNSQVTGEIGSKKTPYPLGVGQEIAVEASQTDHGIKFKKFNPQYAGGSGGGGQRGGQQGGGKREDTNVDRSVAMSYAKDLVVAGKIDINIMFATAEDMLAWVEGKPASQARADNSNLGAIDPPTHDQGGPARTQDEADEIPF